MTIARPHPVLPYVSDDTLSVHGDAVDIFTLLYCLTGIFAESL